MFRKKIKINIQAALMQIQIGNLFVKGFCKRLKRFALCKPLLLVANANLSTEYWCFPDHED